MTLGIRRIPFAVLAGEGAHDRIRIWPKGQRDYVYDLVRVAPASEPVSFEVQTRPAHLQAEATFRRTVDAVRIEAEQIIEGENCSAEISLGRRPVEIRPGPLHSTRIDDDDPTKITIDIDGKQLDPGIWLVNIYVREEGREEWMPLVNSRGDLFAVSIQTGGAFTGSDLQGERSAVWVCPEVDDAMRSQHRYDH